MFEGVDQLVDARKSLNELIGPLMDALKNKDIPLEERWTAYCKIVDNHILVKEMTYGDGFLSELSDPGENELTMYDDFFVDRRQSLDFSSMYRTIMEADEYQESLVTAQKHIDRWRETVLASGYSSFCYDW